MIWNTRTCLYQFVPVEQEKVKHYELVMETLVNFANRFTAGWVCWIKMAVVFDFSVEIELRNFKAAWLFLNWSGHLLVR